MDRATEQLVEIRDQMRELAEQREPPERVNILVGLLLTIQWLAPLDQKGHLACQIHHYAQEAWARTRKRRAARARPENNDDGA